MAGSQVGRVTVALSDDNAANLNTVPITATGMTFAVEANAIRWRADGTPPTATEGQLLNPGDIFTVDGDDYQDFMKKFQIINNTAGSNGTIDGAYLKGNVRH
jgi:hypothetical protein